MDQVQFYQRFNLARHWLFFTRRYSKARAELWRDYSGTMAGHKLLHFLYDSP